MKISSDHEIFVTKIYFNANLERFLNHEDLELYGISCLCMHLPSHVMSNFHERSYYGWQNSRWGDKIVGGDPPEGRLVDS